MGLMKRFFKEGENGFTTVGMAVALLLAVVLAFGAVQARWSQAQAGQIQYVADAAAVAADGAVAELVFYSQVIDATILSLGIVSLAAYAASAVTAFIPGGAGAAASLADTGTKVLEMRRSFSKTAVKGLNAAQKLLPALCTARAMDVLRANSNLSEVSYQGVAIPFPFQGESLDVVDDSSLSDAMEDMTDREGQAQEEAQKQKEAQEKLDKAKKQAWLADCGDDTCMRERAEHLASLNGSQNPMYKSVETWKFSVGLARAKSYYKKRLDQENNASLASMSPEDAGECVARKAFYKYAIDILSKSTITTDSQGNEHPKIDTFAHGKQEFKNTALYIQKSYPVSSGKDGATLHAWSGCPECKGVTCQGSMADVEEGRVAKCASCKFSLTTLWKVSGLTHIVKSGYEYHYQRFVEAADAYCAAAENLERSSKKLEEIADSMGNDWSSALEELVGQRIHLEPTGHYGCVVIVTASDASINVGGSFISHDAKVGTRVAMSGAALAVDSSVDQAAAVQQVGEGLLPSESLSGGAVKALFGAWGSALQAYSNGVAGFQDALSSAFGTIPLVGTDMSTWVGDMFSTTVRSCGLEPAEVVAYKPVVVSTSTILEADESTVASALLKAQSGARAYSEASIGDLSAALDTLSVPDLEDAQFGEDGSVVLAVLSLFKAGLGTGESKIELPDSQNLLNIFNQVLGTLKGAL